MTVESTLDFERIHKGIDSIFQRPWFRRIWVQQEIYAARDLIFRCGRIQFKWSSLLLNPELLYQLPHLKSFVQSLQSKGKFKKQLEMNPPTQLNIKFDQQLASISELENAHKHYLQCFEQFYNHNDRAPDFIETLLNTGSLKASNPKDYYIYGIIGITKTSYKSDVSQRLGNS